MTTGPAIGPDKTSFYNVKTLNFKKKKQSKKYVNQYMTYLVNMQEQMMMEEQY